MTISEPRKKLTYKNFYDDPEEINFNNSLYQDTSLNNTTQKRTKRDFIFLYPKDIEMIFGFSPQEAFEFLVYVRKELREAMKRPVTTADVWYLFDMDSDVIRDFMRES